MRIVSHRMEVVLMYILIESIHLNIFNTYISIPMLVGDISNIIMNIKSTAASAYLPN